MQCQCSCGKTQFAISANVAPIMRVYCHCTICQKYGGEPFADILVFRKKDITAPLFPNLSMVPKDMFGEDVKLPEPIMHMFYEHHINDANDNLPKHIGFIKSQYAFMRELFRGL